MRLILPVLSICLAACSKDGDAGDDFPECEHETGTGTGGEVHNFVDEIGLVIVGMEAYRTVAMGGVLRYDLYMHGDDADTTQVTLSFDGMPIVGMEYEVTESLANDKGVIQVLPMSTAPDLVTGTVIFTEVGTETGDVLALELRLEFTTGRFEGCVRIPIVATGDPDTTGGSGDETADSTG